MSEEHSLDLDTLNDWMVAETIIENKKKCQG
jgi:CMP-N-acetylneuraminic acid synthetase